MTRRDWLKRLIAVPLAAVVPVPRYGLFNPKTDISAQYQRLLLDPEAFIQYYYERSHERDGVIIIHRRWITQ